MIKIIAVSAIALCLLGCTYTEPLTGKDTEALAAQVSYFKDARAGLCFASIKSYTYGSSYVVSIANVPCEKVEALIAGKPQP